MKSRALPLLILLIVAVFIWMLLTRPSGQSAVTADSGEVSIHMLLGNPSKASADGADKNNYLMVKPYFALSYNNQAGEPNWVSWRLTADDLGDAPRKQTFATDTTLPPGFTAITTHDYTSTGFDRGHMCPHSDRAHDKDMSYATFVMTNIIPQAPNVNQKAWDQMEMYLRTLAKDGARLYITAGPAGRGGRGSRGLAETIGQGRVVVPAMCWKIAVVLPGGAAGGDDLANITPATRVISVLVPNDNSVGETWGQYRTSVAVIEKTTGLNFFDRLPPATAAALKTKVDDMKLPPPIAAIHGAGDEP